MVRHPHFTQPIFVRFPRPAVLRGRDGVERYPQAADVPLDAAVLRELRQLDPAITLGWVQDVDRAVRGRGGAARAHATLARARRPTCGAYFLAQLRPVVRRSPPRPRRRASRSRALRADDPYGF